MDAALLIPSPNLRLLSQGTGRTTVKQNFYKLDVGQPTGKVC